MPLLPPGLDPQPTRRDSDPPVGRKRSGVVLGILLVFAALSTMLVVVSGIYWWKYHTFNNSLHRLPIFGAAAPNTPSHDIDGKDQNILIVGNDDRETATDAELRQLGTARDGGSLNTDTMMIVHVPANGKKAALISLPRDSWVAIPGYGMGKLNSAYPDAFTATTGSTDAKRAAGGRLLIGTIQNLTGLTIDHFVQVDLLGFYRISIAIHGVQVNMCAAVKESNSGIDLHQGINDVEGKQALAFVRQRYNFPDGNGDLDRVQRQRYFLTAAFRKLTSAGTLLNPSKLQHLLTAVSSSLYLDEKINLTDLAGQLEGLSANNIVGQTIPTDGFGNVNGQSIVVVTPSEVKTFVNRIIGNVDSKVDSAKTVKPSSVTVDVKNGGSSDGAAGQNASTLRRVGFVIASTETAPSTSTATVIQYSDGLESQAKTLAAYVPGATLQKVSGLKHVTLVLGADQLDAKPDAIPATAASSSAGATQPSTPATDQPPTPAAAASSSAAKTSPKAIDAGCIN
jgi:LCP family protein required for cell wall assembly